MCISNKQVSLESTRAHLQKQLRQKEADCNRMAVQIRVGRHETVALIQQLVALCDEVKLLSCVLEK